MTQSLKELSPSNFSCFSSISTDMRQSYNKNPVFQFLNGTCIEKPDFFNLKFNQKEVNDIKNGSLLFQDKIGGNLKKSSNFSNIDNNKYYMRHSYVNNSYPTKLPQWIKNDKLVLKFEGYVNEHVVESNVENYRIRPCYIYFYLEDDTIQVFEMRTENSGIPQGTIVKRQMINKDKNTFYSYSDFNLGTNISIFGKSFRICKCDKFTTNFYKEKNITLNKPEEIPEYVNPNFEMIKKIDTKENLKNIAEYKEFYEINLGGGHPNIGLKTFLFNDRKVLSFDILWDDVHHDKELKQYKMNYYLSDNMVEIRELKESNSGKGNFPYLLKKSILPKYPKFTYCPGLNKREEEIYKPEDLILGNYVNVFNRPCFIFDCDEFTKEWFKKK